MLARAIRSVNSISRLLINGRSEGALRAPLEYFAIALPTVLLAGKKPMALTRHLSARPPRPALGALSESPLTPRSGVSEDAVRAASEGGGARNVRLIFYHGGVGCAVTETP